MTRQQLHNSFLQALCLEGERSEARRKKKRKRERRGKKEGRKEGRRSSRSPGGVCEDEGEADQWGVHVTVE